VPADHASLEEDVPLLGVPLLVKEIGSRPPPHRGRLVAVSDPPLAQTLGERGHRFRDFSHKARAARITAPLTVNETTISVVFMRRAPVL